MIRVKIKCSYCGREISKSNYQKHIKVCKGLKKDFKLNHEGLVCQYCGKVCKNRNSLCNHERLCKENPNRQESYLTLNNVISPYRENQYTKAKKLGLPPPKYEITEETKSKISKNNSSHRPEVRQKISESMKKAILEGRAKPWIGLRKGEHSYPEKVIIDILSEDFGLIENVNYKTEYPFMGQFLDFAWVSEKACIEMDGSQHERFQDIKERDIKKDNNLSNSGWTLLRLKWRDYFSKKSFLREKLKKDIELYLLENKIIAR